LPAYRAHLGQLLRPSYQALGLFAPAGEDDPERTLKRAAVVRALALSVRDPELVGRLSAIGRADLAGERTPELTKLAPDLRDEALAAALRTGGAPALDQAIARLEKTEDAQVRTRLLSAMGAVEDPALSQRVLDLLLDPVLRTNERLSLLYGQISQRSTRERAYSWLKQNFGPYTAKLGENARSHVFGIVGYFCSAERAAEAKAFFAPKAEAIPGGSRELDRALESIAHCRALVTAQAPSARAYFGPAR
jgi:aminopeptidase N